MIIKFLLIDTSLFLWLQDIINDSSLVTYSVKDIRVPSLSGKPFSFLSWFCFTRLGRYLCTPTLMKGANLYRLSGEYIPDAPVVNFRFLCPPPLEEDYTQENKRLIQRLLDEEEEEEDSTEAKFRFPSIRDYYKAYKEERCTPVEVANVILEAIKKSNSVVPPLRAIVDYSEVEIIKMAQASMERWQNEKPLSILDGVPISIKGEFNTDPYSYRCGSLFCPVFAETTPEAHLVKNLKEAGAIIIGITNMNEFGSGANGSNPNRFNRIPRNPYNTACYPGGSSSGSAVSVAAGLCPISIGADGGGSIRIPASLCGLIGFKPTQGFLESTGEMPLSQSVACPGPLCGTALDTIVAMDTLARNSHGVNPLSLRGIGARTLGGLRIGIYQDYFNHCDDNVRKICESSLELLKDLGAVIVDIQIPELEEAQIALFITIFSEIATGLACDVDKHFNLFNPETLLVLVPGFQFRAVDYLNAQKQRTRSIFFLREIFKKVDVIVTPMTGCVAPKIDEDAINCGKTMTEISGKLVRYATLANLTGNPAMTCPIGFSDDGLPIGLQFMGKWFDETTLLSICWVLEKSKRFPTGKPGIFHDILKSTTKIDV